MDQSVVKPDFCEREHLIFLEKLNDKGVNMFVAAPHLEREFGLSSDQSKAVLKYWIASKR